MRQKLWALAACAALAVSLAGCAPSDNTQIQNPFQSAQSSQNEQSSTEEVETPSPELKVRTEKGIETVAATIYTGSQYTIAIPAEGWERDSNEPQWNLKDNDDVELTVRYYTGKTAEDAVKLVMEDEDDYAFGAAKAVTLGSGLAATEISGEETEFEDGVETVTDQMIVYFVEMEKGCYALLLECPEEAAEAYGGYLAAMANSFTLVETQTQTTLRQSSAQQ